MIQLEAIRYVDEIVVYNTEKELIEWLKILKPDIRILGSDYEGKKFTGDFLDIDIYYHERSHDWSTSDLRKRVSAKELK